MRPYHVLNPQAFKRWLALYLHLFGLKSIAPVHGVSIVLATFAESSHTMYCVQEHMKTQLEFARAVYRWVVRNITFPADNMWGQSVTAPLLPGHDAIEEKLCMSSTGTWSERTALLFVSLAKACHLEAVTVSGFWRHEGCAISKPHPV